MINKIILYTLLLISLLLFLTNCDPDTEIADIGDPVTCEGCHTSKSTLQQYATADDSHSSGGG
jgi:hypothetical protein